MNPISPDSQALPPGTQLHEFVIERILGSGGFGITYLARDTSLAGRKAVIKENMPSHFAWRETAAGTVRPRHTTGNDKDDFEWSLRNFLREAETLASLEHPGIVRVLRKFEANGTAYFVMPFVDGVPLDALIAERHGMNKPFLEDELRGLLTRLLPALDHLHERGIYHRDIKPGNILISEEGLGNRKTHTDPAQSANTLADWATVDLAKIRLAPILIDFGSARQRLSERSMTVIESIGYTPFEQLQSRGNVGPWSDLYALGGTLYKAITGETLPRANDRAFDDPYQPLTERSELAAGYTKAFLQTIDKALAAHERDRWRCAEDWMKEIGNQHDAHPPQAVRPQVKTPPPFPTAPSQPNEQSHSKETAQSKRGRTERSLAIGISALAALIVISTYALNKKDPVVDAVQESESRTKLGAKTLEEKNNWIEISANLGANEVAMFGTLVGVNDDFIAVGLTTTNPYYYRFANQFQGSVIQLHDKNTQGISNAFFLLLDDETPEKVIFKCDGSLLYLNNQVRSLSLKGSETDRVFDSWFLNSSDLDKKALHSIVADADALKKYQKEIEQIYEINRNLVKSYNGCYAIKGILQIGKETSVSDLEAVRWEAVSHLSIRSQPSWSVVGHLLKISVPILQSMEISVATSDEGYDADSYIMLLQKFSHISQLHAPLIEEMPQLPALRHLSLTLPQKSSAMNINLDFISKPEALRSLEIDLPKDSTDSTARLTGIDRFAGLEYLSSGVPFSGIAGIDTLQKLKYVRSTSKEVDLKDLANLPPQIEGLSFKEQMIGSSSDTVPGNQYLRHEAFARFQKLKYLGVPAVKDAEKVYENNLTALRKSRPDLIIYLEAGGICLGSGWLMIIALILLALPMIQRYRQQSKQNNG